MVVTLLAGVPGDCEKSATSYKTTTHQIAGKLSKIGKIRHSSKTLLTGRQTTVFGDNKKEALAFVQGLLYKNQKGNLDLHH
jgi:hypothetical protein